MEAAWIWLNTPPGVVGVLDPFGLIFASAFGVGFVVSAYLAGPCGKALARDDAHTEAIAHWSNVGLWMFGSGLFFFAVRALQMNPLSFGEPIWLVGCVIALIVAAIRFAEWWRKNHPLEETPITCHPARKQHPPRPLRWARGAGG